MRYQPSLLKIVAYFILLVKFQMVERWISKSSWTPTVPRSPNPFLSAMRTQSSPDEVSISMLSIKSTAIKSPSDKPGYSVNKHDWPLLHHAQISTFLKVRTNSSATRQCLYWIFLQDAIFRAKKHLKIVPLTLQQKRCTSNTLLCFAWSNTIHLWNWSRKPPVTRSPFVSPY